jgi:hypothetical protein
MGIAKTKAKLDKIFSQFIRLRAVNDEGYGECFTCGRLRFYKNADAGHFMVRQKMPTRFDELNVQFQCKVCNGFEGGAQYEFAKRLDEIYGEGTAEAILLKSNQTKKWTVEELEEKCRYYRRKVNEIKAQRGLE